MTSTRISLITALLSIVALTSMLFSQTETATVSGRVTDTDGAVVVGTKVQLESIERGTTQTAATNSAGIYVFVGVQPGQYHMTVAKPGFRQIEVTGLILNVQDHTEKNFRLEVGSASESVTVSSSSPLLNTTDASVSTVVDRNFADKLPLNGRSFQTLIYLSPGVIPVAVQGEDSGQFSVNGQRAASNYWMVDGVSANVGASTTFAGQQLAGSVGATSVLGGTNSLVSVDAMQEFRIQTSTFAPEFGRTPGGQISIVTRSGTNEFHGSVFDYLRNDALDASNWFNGYINNPPLPKAKERQNDFGGTLGGPIFKDKTFFFFSYEGLRLRLPVTALSRVPDALARQNANPAVQPLLNAFPFDPQQPDLGNGVSRFNVSFSNPASLDDYSIRIDHQVSGKLTIFGRYNDSPSQIGQRGASGAPLSTMATSRIDGRQITAGAEWNISGLAIDEARFNYSRTNATLIQSLDGFGGATPLSSVALPAPFTVNDSVFQAFIVALNPFGILGIGPSTQSIQQQYNFVDNVTLQRGSHSLRIGVDYRQLRPVFAPRRYSQTVSFRNVTSAAAGTVLTSSVSTGVGATLKFQNLSFFAQDTWRVIPRFTMTFGVRWDTDFAPSAASGPSFPAITGFSTIGNLSAAVLAPAGTPAFQNHYRNFAPRFGAAYQMAQRQNWATVVRGGVGVFYDLASSEAANVILAGGFPYGSGRNVVRGGSFPLSQQSAAAPAIAPPSPANPGPLGAFDPHLQLPYTVEGNFGVEQGLGSQQSLSAAYVASSGRRLIQTASVGIPPSPSITRLSLVNNSASSSYNSFQAQFERRLRSGLQVTTGYTWSHSIDNASGGSTGTSSNLPASPGNPGNRGSSDFDIRHSLSLGLTYSIPNPLKSTFLREVTGGWSLQNIVQAQSARPVPILDGNFSTLTNGFDPDIRPDIVSGVPLYLYGPQYPGGKAINNTVGALPGGCPDGSPSVGPFCDPPSDANGFALRQGTLGRNVVRGFGLFQWNLGVHREFTLHESVKMVFRSELFNALNHPNFSPQDGDITSPTFGLSTQTLGNYLSGGIQGNGSFSSLYQIGGPRSVQFALTIRF